MKDEVLDLTKQLISRRSITPEDAGCQDLIADILKDCGFAVKHMKFGDVDNLWATYGEQQPRCVFAGHTDVVPTGSLNLWASDPFEPTIRDDHLFGRGAADMKSSIAAMVIAAKEFCREHPEPKSSIGFLITSDEEGEAVNGTVKVIDELYANNETFNYAIVGEPSSSETVGDVMRVGRRGSLSGQLKLTGTLGHVAYADITPNPIHELIRTFVSLVERTWDHGNDFFTPTTFQISNLNSGTGALNVIPAELLLEFNFRFNTEQTKESLIAVVEQQIDAIHPEIKSAIKWNQSGQPFLSSQANLTEAAVGAIEDVMGIQTSKSTSGGTSDARFLVPKGIETVEIGPVNHTIHKINECVAVDELEPLANIYLRTLERLLL